MPPRTLPARPSIAGATLPAQKLLRAKVVQRKPPHAATVAQARRPFGSVPARPPHPATAAARAVQTAQRAIQRMDWEYTPPEFDEDIHEYDDFGNIVYKEPEGGWDEYAQWANEEFRKQQQEKIERENEEREFERCLEIAKKWGKEHEEAIWYLFSLIGRVENVKRLVDAFVESMTKQQYAFVAGYLFQIEQTKALDEGKKYTLVKVEPSLFDVLGENRFGDVFVVNNETKKGVIVEIKNWTGYLKGATKSSTLEEKKKREQERKSLFERLTTQLERYLKTEHDVLFIWKGQMPIELSFYLPKLANTYKGRFFYKTA